MSHAERVLRAIGDGQIFWYTGCCTFASAERGLESSTYTSNCLWVLHRRGLIRRGNRGLVLLTDGGRRKLAGQRQNEPVT